MRLKFSQTSAAIIIEKLQPFIRNKCHDNGAYIDFLKKLCKAAYIVYGENTNLKDSYKSFIIFSFTNASYFLIDSFNADLEDRIFNDIIFPVKDDVMNTVMSALGFENSIADNSNSLNDYFDTDIFNLFERDFGSGFKIAHDNSLFKSNDLRIPDLKSTFKNDFINHIPFVTKKRKSLNSNSIREFLVYYTVDLLEGYQKEANYLPETVMHQVYDQMETVSDIIFTVPFEEISPEEEIFDNYTTDLLFKTKSKYLEFLHS
jgi:hypothetical protein